ncbi:MAG TPA: hypothetical protein VGF34_04750 [Stellaceae bacterium]|jgi:hypothetical protein
MTIADQYRVPLRDGGTAPMPQPVRPEPGGRTSRPLGPEAPVSPRPGAPAATPPRPYGPETRPAPVFGGQPVPMPGAANGGR